MTTHHRASAEPAPAGDDGDIEVGTVFTNTTVWAASLNTGQRLLGTADTFVDNQSQFDRQSRLGLSESALVVSKERYLGFVAGQVMAWTAEDIKPLKGQLTELRRMFARWPGVVLPDTVYLVKTSGREEAGAAYTRHGNVIALPAPRVTEKDLIAHEFFHLVSKNNPVLREVLYRGVNYSVLGAPVAVPDVPWPDPGSPQSMRKMTITNPDQPLIDVSIRMLVPERPEDPDSPLVHRDLAPILMATRPYDTGKFFLFLASYLMAITTDPSGAAVPVIGDDGRPIMYLLGEENAKLWDQYLDLIGRNFTEELYQPDEIVAQGFVFAAQLPELALIGRIEDALVNAGTR